MGLTYSSVMPAEPNEVFAWHSRPGAITRLLPPWQPVRVTQEATSVRDGQAVLTLPGGLRWTADHDPDSYDPPRQFAQHWCGQFAGRAVALDHRNQTIMRRNAHAGLPVMLDGA